MRLASTILLMATTAFGQTAPHAVIAGAVSEASNNEPIRKAIVTLTLIGTPRTWATERTDSSGQFRFEGLPPGKYDLRANKAELGTAIYGANSARETGESITLADGEARTGLQLRFIRSASVAGRVFDSDGDPVPGAIVTLLRATRTLGERVLVNYRPTNTDDRGQYRITGLDPGQYYLLATPQNNRGFPQNLRDGIPTAILASAYYGGARESKDAAPVNVRSGESLEGMDFHLGIEEAHPIRGRITGVPDLGPSPDPSSRVLQGGPGRMVNVQLTWASTELGRGGYGIGAAPPDYKFDFGALPPGRYTIEATVRDGDKTWAASQPVDSSQPLPEVILALAPAIDVSGQLRIEGKAPPSPQPLGVTLTRDNGRSANLSAAPSPDGHFAVRQVPPGEWVVNVNPLPEGSYLKSARYGDTDVRFARFTVAPGAPEALNIVISMNTAKVDGQVDAAAGDAKRAGIVLAPTGKLHTLARYYYGTVADDDGKFHITGIAPGTYKIFALEKLAPLDFRNPEAADQLNESGTDIEIGEGATVEAHPKLISMERARQALPEARQ